MANEVLTTLLSEYEQKKRKAEFDAEKRKEKLYKQILELQEIENELNSTAIKTAKNILLGSTESNTNFNKKILELKNKKQKILEENNISEEFFQPNYECKICKDTGYVQSNDYTSTLCNCIKQKLLDVSYNMSNLYKENFDTFNPNIFSDKIDSNKYKVNISPRQNIISIKEKCLDFVKNFDNPNYKNLMFTGNTGLGKTFMSNSIAYELIKNGKSVLYQTEPVLLETVINNKMNKYKNSFEDTFYKDVLEVDLLIIDDLGTDCMNTMKLKELFTILNTRLLNLNNKITKTIISTNLNINNIFTNYEERIGSRIAGFYDIYYFFGDDLRLKKKK